MWRIIIVMSSLLLMFMTGCQTIEEEKAEIRLAAPELNEEAHKALLMETLEGMGLKGEVEEIDFDREGVLAEMFDVDLRTQEEMWDIMHQMANTKIVAKKIWGEVEITEDLVDKLIIEVSASEYSDKMKLLHILER